MNRSPRFTAKTKARIRRKRPPITALSSYRCPALVAAFSREFKIPAEESADIFAETKKWLWLINEFDAERPRGFKKAQGLPLFSHFRAIDEMWHSFIVFTVPYTKFCDKFFGTYIHHHPYNGQKHNKRTHQKNLTWFVGYLSDKLGENTAAKWLNFYPERYAKSFKNESDPTEFGLRKDAYLPQRGKR